MIILVFLDYNYFFIYLFIVVECKFFEGINNVLFIVLSLEFGKDDDF